MFGAFRGVFSTTAAVVFLPKNKTLVVPSGAKDPREAFRHLQTLPNGNVRPTEPYTGAWVRHALQKKFPSKPDRELAEMIGVSPQVFANWNRKDKTSLPGAKTLYIAYRILGLLEDKDVPLNRIVMPYEVLHRQVQQAIG